MADDKGSESRQLDTAVMVCEQCQEWRHHFSRLRDEWRETVCDFCGAVARQERVKAPKAENEASKGGNDK